jgi:hypothetical protein
MVENNLPFFKSAAILAKRFRSVKPPRLSLAMSNLQLQGKRMLAESSN